MDKVQRILVIVQGTEDCLAVFDYAAGLAETLRAKLFVLDIIHNPFAYTGWNLPMPSMAEGVRGLLRVDTGAYQGDDRRKDEARAFP